MHGRPQKRAAALEPGIWIDRMVGPASVDLQLAIGSTHLVCSVILFYQYSTLSRFAYLICWAFCTPPLHCPFYLNFIETKFFKLSC